MKTNDILKIDAFNNEKYEDISLTLLTAYSLYWLEEWMLSTTIEAIAVLNFKLFPVKFSMVSFPQYPDGFRTNRSLMQLGRKYRNWASGSAKEAYALNERGLEEAEALIRRIGTPTLLENEKRTIVIQPQIKSKKNSDKARTVHPEEQIEKLKNSTLYELYLRNQFEDPPIIHLLGLLDLYDNAHPKVKRRKLKEYERAAQELNDKAVIIFINEIKQIFKEYLNK